ncbi:MAG: DUF6599 family protein [Candidatus Zixiibacteriota bacterium]
MSICQVRIFVVLWLLMAAAITAENAEPVIPGDGIAPGWTRNGHMRTFNQNDLYGHIDGGAELFLEFGFDKLLVQKYTNGDNEIELEIYLMTEPAAALGIYLMKCGRETPLDDIPCRNTANSYQLTLVKNRCFIQLNNFNGRKALVPVMTALARSTLEGIEPEDKVLFFENLPGEDLIEHSELLVRGPYGLQPIYTFGEGDIFLLGGKVFGVVGDYRIDSVETYTAIIIPYPDVKAAEKAFHNLNVNLDTYLEIVEQSDRLLVFKDFVDKYGQVILDDNILRIKINLTDKP